jgi:4-hydroxy-tetrahydrodipicolinate synthase
MALPYTKSEAKQWAKENFIGLEAPVFPSFTPDMSELDEDGIRWDVNHIIANGMICILAASEACGLTHEERKRFISIVNDEAKGRAFTSISALMDTVEQNIDLLQHHEKTGGTLAMIGHPLQYDPESEEELYRNYKYMCDSTNLAVHFYPGRLRLKRFHPSGWPMSIVPRIAEIPNVVMMKFAGGTPLQMTLQCFHMVGDLILVADAMPDRWFVTIPKYGQQWAGAGPFYTMQTPEDQRSVKLFNALRENRLDDAFEMAWKNAAYGAMAGASMGQVSYLETGIVSPGIDKYAHWCLGGNGGLVRQPARRLYDYQKEAIRAGLKAIGFEPRENEEEYILGRTNYAKGARLKRY